MLIVRIKKSSIRSSFLKTSLRGACSLFLLASFGCPTNREPLRTAPVNPENQNQQKFDSPFGQNMDGQLNFDSRTMDPSLKPENPGEISYGEIFKVPQGAYLIQVRALIGDFKIIKMTKKLMSGEGRGKNTAGLTQLSEENLPKNLNEISYLFFRPGDEIEIKYKVAMNNNPNPVPSYTRVFEFLALGGENCLGLSVDSLDTLTQKMKLESTQKNIFIGRVACLGNNKLIEKIKSSNTPEKIGYFIQDWNELIKNETENGTFDVLMRLVNRISQVRFISGMPTALAVPKDVNRMSPESFELAFNKFVDSLPKEKRKLGALSMLSEAVKYPFMTEMLAYLANASEKNWTYSGLVSDVEKNEYLLGLMRRYQDRLTQVNDFFNRKYSDTLGSKKIIDGLVVLTKSLDLRNKSLTTSLVTLAENIGVEFSRFRDAFESQKSYLKKKEKRKINVERVGKKWDNYVSAVSAFQDKLASTDDGSKGMIDRENATSFNRIRTDSLMESGKKLSEAIAEMSNPVVSQAILEHNIGVKAFVQIDANSDGVTGLEDITEEGSDENWQVKKNEETAKLIKDEEVNSKDVEVNGEEEDDAEDEKPGPSAAFDRTSP